MLDYLLKPLKKNELTRVLQKVERMIWIDRSKEETAYINNSDDREFEAALLTVGPYIMLREDYAFTEGQNRIDEQLNSFLDKYISDELRWIIPTKYENERINCIPEAGRKNKEYS